MLRTAAVSCAVVAAAVALHPGTASACSLVPTYMPPTNYELVADTARIVIAVAGAELPAAKGDDDEIGRVEFEVETVLRGSGIAAGDHFAVEGSTRGYLGASARNDFSKARPGAYTGACTAWDYKTGKHYLLLLEQYGGRWVTRGTPLTRVNEEVDPKGDAWITAVTDYVRIAALATPDLRRKALDALVTAGSKAHASAADQAIAADVTSHLATPSPYKPFAELEPMYTAARGDAKGPVMLAIGTGADVAARPFMKQVVTDLAAGKPPVDEAVVLEAVAAYYDKVVDRDALTALAALYVALGTKHKQDRWSLMWLLVHHADGSHQAVMERAFAGADDEEAGRLAEWFVAHPSAAMLAAMNKRVDGKYGEHNEIARALAGMGDKPVIAWARQKLADKPDDDRWIALYALAVSPTKDADTLAGKVIKSGGDDLVALIQGYAEAHHPRVDARLKQIAAIKGLSKEARTWLDRTVDARKKTP